MLTKQLLTRSIALRRRAANLTRQYHQVGHHPKATMNDLPVPQGDWQELHAKRNAKYNAVLATGVILFATAVTIAKSSGLIHLNYSPPKSYE